MRWLLYLRLILLTAGTLLPFFWMVVILGHRRQRNFERIFFFLCLALTSFFGGSLLALNAELYYGTPREGLSRFCWVVICLGLWFIPPLIMHLHVEYAHVREMLRQKPSYRKRVISVYFPVVALSPLLAKALELSQGMDFEHPAHILGPFYQVYLTAAFVLACLWQYRFAQAAPDQQQKSFHRTLQVAFLFLLAFFPLVFITPRILGPGSASAVSSLLFALALVPFGLLITKVERFNFLQIGRQRNLMYAVFGVFIALLYLSFVRRASEWLEPYLPPAASAALLLFLPIVFFEPLQRLVRQLLQHTAQRELDDVYPLLVQIHSEASKGNLKSLVALIEQGVREKFQFENVCLTILEPQVDLPHAPRTERHGDESFSVYRPGRLNGLITVRPHGSMISGETVGAMKILSESVAGAIDMCIVLEQKLQLERELAERERLALVGQMAASISHNLKNPLGAIKTILQVQLENPGLPENLRAETQMVLEEINRLSAKLNQLLQFSRPGAQGPAKTASCDLREVITDVLNVLRPEAEQRGVRLGSRLADRDMNVDASPEALHDIVSNLVVNAIDASPPGGEVRVQVSWRGLPCVVSVEDEGPGIPVDLQEKVLQPFFTTKPQGTGLGLAVVVKRVSELGGELKMVSPVNEGRGTRFEVKIWPGVVRHETVRTEMQTQPSERP